jgi:hypothetical protein
MSRRVTRKIEWWNSCSAKERRHRSRGIHRAPPRASGRAEAGIDPTALGERQQSGSSFLAIHGDGDLANSICGLRGFRIIGGSLRYFCFGAVGQSKPLC